MSETPPKVRQRKAPPKPKPKSKERRSEDSSTPRSDLPSHYQREDMKASESDIELTETFISSLPDVETIPGRGVSGMVRDHRDYVDAPIDPETGKPLLDFRWGSDTIPGRRERNIGKGFVPCPVKDRKPVPPGTPGAKNVTVAGATLLVRKAEIAKLKRDRNREHSMRLARRSRENLNENLYKAARDGEVEVVESSRHSELVHSNEE